MVAFITLVVVALAALLIIWVACYRSAPGTFPAVVDVTLRFMGIVALLWFIFGVTAGGWLH